MCRGRKRNANRIASSGANLCRWLRQRLSSDLACTYLTRPHGSESPGTWRAQWQILLLLVFLNGCQQEMANQPRYDTLEASPTITDGMWSRKPVPGTVARGELQLDDAFFTGKVGDTLVSELPDRALANRSLGELLARGKIRYNVVCSHCHGQVGGGTGGDEVMREAVGMVVRRGFPMPPTYHQDRLRRAPIGHFFDVITNGLGRMAPHGYLVRPEDRWAISAYIRALQLSQHAPRAELTETDISKLAATESIPNDAAGDPSEARPPAASSDESSQ